MQKHSYDVVTRVLNECFLFDGMEKEIMDRIDVDYAALERECAHFISRNTAWAMATAAGNRVTCRTVFTVNVGLKLYLQTDTRLTKHRQLLTNPNVALCRDHVQIEGVAKDMGHPLTPKNQYFCDLYKRQHPRFFDIYTAVPTQSVVEVTPTLITTWHHDEENGYRNFLMIIARKAYREDYSTGTA